VIVLDTNVLSELMGREPSRRVATWLDEQPEARLFTTALTEAEIGYGIACLPAGRRRRALAAAAARMFDELFAGRILPFDRAAAQVYAELAAERRRAGRPIAQVDAQIAAIARSRRAVVATRDRSGFEGCGVELVNPWG